jgi:hypothetical protein
MSQARIYQPTKTAMQSGVAGAKNWVLEFEYDNERFIEPLMGWTASKDLQQQVILHFKTKEEAIKYAEKHQISYMLYKPNQKIVKPKSYSDNFMK